MSLKGKSTNDKVKIAQTELVEADNVFRSSRIDTEEWKRFYLGQNQWDGVEPEGDLKMVVPITSIMLDQHVFLFTNKPPRINFKPPSASPLDRIKAQIGEDHFRSFLYDSEFPLLFQQSQAIVAQMGSVNQYLFWDSVDKKRSSRGTAKLTYLSPSTSRIVHGNGFRFHPTALVFWERMNGDAIRAKFPDFKGKIYADSNYAWVKVFNFAVDDGKTSVFTYVDDEVYLCFLGDGTVLDEGDHNLGFVPVRTINQIYVPDNITSIPLLYNADALQKYLNVLFSSAIELALDLAYPPLLEYNNALGGQKIKKWRRRKIKVRRSDKGESLSYLTPVGNVQLLLNQIQGLIDLCYVVLQMPPTAMGVVKSQITSGYQAQVYQLPATVKEGSWGVQWRVGLQDIASKFIKMLMKKNPEALAVEVANGEKLTLDGIENYEVVVEFAEATPIDEVRNTQMMVIRLQNGLIDLFQALDKLGDDNPFDTMERIKQEGQDPILNPKKAVEIATARAQIGQIAGQLLGTVNAMGGQAAMSPEMAQRLPPELQQMANMQNQNNVALSSPEALRGTEEQRPYPPQGGERVAQESAGAGITPPAGVGY